MIAPEIAARPPGAEPIKVHVVRFRDRKNLMLRYADPGTGRMVHRSSGTADRLQAKTFAKIMESQLNDPGLAYLRDLDDDTTPRNERVGVIYFVRSATGNLKIGWSADPDRRIVQLLSILEFSAVPVAFMAGSMTAERKVHCALMASRMPGKREWFFPTDQVREFIQSRAQAVEGDWRLFLLERFS